MSWCPTRQLQMQTLRGDDVNKENILRTINPFRPAATMPSSSSGRATALTTTWGTTSTFPTATALYRRWDVVTAMRLPWADDWWLCFLEAATRYRRLPFSGCTGLHVCVYPTFDDKACRDISPIAEELFLKPRGIVDINGASEGQLGFADHERGCSFSIPLPIIFARNSERTVSGRPSSTR